MFPIFSELIQSKKISDPLVFYEENQGKNLFHIAIFHEYKVQSKQEGEYPALF